MKQNNSVMYGAIVYSLFVGFVCSAIAILGLLMRWCVLEAKGSPLIYMLYMLYYRVESCEPRFQWSRFKINNYVDVRMPFESQAVSRTYILTLIYLGLHIGLIVSAFLALYGLRRRRATRKNHSFYSIPLVLILIATVIFDVLATVYYTLDFIAFMKDDGLMSILEVRNVNDSRSNFEQLPYTARYVPPIIMCLITSKLLFFLICNIVWAVTIVYTNYSKPKASNEVTVNVSKTNYDAAIMANDNPAFEDEKSDEKSTKHDKISNKEYEEVPEKRYDDTSRVKDFIYPHHVYARSNKQSSDEAFDDDSLDFKIQRPILTASYYSNSSQRASKLQQYPNGTYDDDVEMRLSHFQKCNGNVEHDEITPDISYKEMRIRPTPPPKPNRQDVHARPSSTYFLNATGHEDSINYRPDSGLSSETRTDRSSGHFRAPQELRSQLPWSYFKSSNEVPRHALVHSDDNEIPETPLPDYDNGVTRRKHF